MELTRKLANGKVMTLCIHCDRVSHTYNGKCTCCGSFKEYDFFFKLDAEKRTKLLDTLSQYNKK